MKKEKTRTPHAPTSCEIRKHLAADCFKSLSYYGCVTSRLFGIEHVQFLRLPWIVGAPKAKHFLNHSLAHPNCREKKSRKRSSGREWKYFNWFRCFKWEGEHPYLYKNSTRYNHLLTFDRVAEIASSHPPTIGIYAENSLEHETINVSLVFENVPEAPLGFGQAFVNVARSLTHGNLAIATHIHGFSTK